MMTPLRTGVALASASDLFYSPCALFHGMDFSSMVQPKSFAFTGVLTSLLVLSAWALLAGGFFSWLLSRLTPSALLVSRF